ncbi:hypothetical protein OPV22_022429 [Ensete ventricosum]|uniref:Uncharacterized protein n=1 Tax=Ensete ventricosum TaxID=4639 RepID=A0AAV8QSW2_ENSVE|nr:hypothetical protein OPV22_022429 [Ensete ventricosum]
MVVAADRTVWVTVTRIEGVKSKRLLDESRTLPQALVPPHIQICFAGSTASVALRVTGYLLAFSSSSSVARKVSSVHLLLLFVSSRSIRSSWASAAAGGGSRDHSREECRT